MGLTPESGHVGGQARGFAAKDSDRIDEFNDATALHLMWRTKMAPLLPAFMRNRRDEFSSLYGVA